MTKILQNFPLNWIPYGLPTSTQLSWSEIPQSASISRTSDKRHVIFTRDQKSGKLTSDKQKTSIDIYNDCNVTMVNINRTIFLDRFRVIILAPESYFQALLRSNCPFFALSGWHARYQAGIKTRLFHHKVTWGCKRKLN